MKDGTNGEEKEKKQKKTKKRRKKRRKKNWLESTPVARAPKTNDVWELDGVASKGISYLAPPAPVNVNFVNWRPWSQ